MPLISPAVVQPIALFAILALSVAIVGSNDFSVGVDAGIHHAVAAQLSEHGQWPLPATPFLYGITHYPPAAHVLGAVIGLAAGSTFGGMLLVNALALVVAGLALSYFIRRASLAETVGSIIVFLILCAAFRKHRFLIGNEVVANFFYGQFAGTAALLASFVFLAKLRWSYPYWFALSAALTFAVGWFFPLNAIHLAIAAAFLRLRPLLLFDRAKIGLVEFMVTGLALSAVAFLHPTMADMKAISLNDGGISVSNAAMATSLLFLIVAILPFLVLRGNRSGIVDPNALVAIIVGAVIPPLLQFGLLVLFDLGSPYAVKKSGFLVGTLSLLAASVILMEWRPLQRAALRLTYEPVIPFVRVLTGPALVLIILTAVYKGRASTPVIEISQYQQQLSSFVATHGLSNLSGRTVSMNSSVSPHTNHLVGFAQLHPSPGTQKAQIALLLPGPRLIPGAELAILAAADASRYDPSCIRYGGDKLAAVSTGCLLQPPTASSQPRAG